MNMIALPLRRGLLAALVATAFALPAQALALELPGAAPAVPEPLPVYEPQRTTSILFYPTDDARSRGARAIDLKRIDAYLDALRAHAGNRAPKFHAAAQQQAARRDATTLGLALAALDRPPDAQVQLEALQARSARLASGYPVTETLAVLRAAPAPKP